MSNEELIKMAENIKLNAVADITGYKVGAILLADSGKIYPGVNVEEKTMPNLSICAERNAFQDAFTYGERKFLKIAVVGGIGDNIDNTLIPCGVCLEYMMDLCPDIKIVVYINGKIEEKKVQDFLGVPYLLNKKI